MVPKFSTIVCKMSICPICQLWSPNGPIRSSNGQIWFPNDLFWSLNGQLMVGVKEKEGWVKGFLVIFQKINRRDLGGRIFIYERHGHGQLGMGKLLFGPHITSVWCFNWHIIFWASSWNVSQFNMNIEKQYSCGQLKHRKTNNTSFGTTISNIGYSTRTLYHSDF